MTEPDIRNCSSLRMSTSSLLPTLLRSTCGCLLLNRVIPLVMFGCFLSFQFLSIYSGFWWSFLSVCCYSLPCFSSCRISLFIRYLFLAWCRWLLPLGRYYIFLSLNIPVYTVYHFFLFLTFSAVTFFTTCTSFSMFFTYFAFFLCSSIYKNKMKP